MSTVPHFYDDEDEDDDYEDEEDEDDDYDEEDDEYDDEEDQPILIAKNLRYCFAAKNFALRFAINN